MNWGNYGKWHLDHIIPISFAKNEEGVKKINHYTNFQPLEATENIVKRNKFPFERGMLVNKYKDNGHTINVYSKEKQRCKKI